VGFLLAALGQVLEPAAVDVVAGDDCDPARRHRPQRRRPPPALEQRHLAEDGAGPHLGDRLAVPLDGEHTVEQQEQLLARRSLSPQGLCSGDACAYQLRKSISPVLAASRPAWS